MKVEFLLTLFASLVGNVAGFATHVERPMAAAFLRNINADLVATQAKVLFRIPGRRLEQLILIIGSMWIVTLDAIANRRTVNDPLDVGRVLVGVTGDAKT